MSTASDLDHHRGNGSLRVIVEAHARPGCAEQLKQQAAQLVEPTRAERSNLGYDIVQALDKEDHFFFIEEWESQKSFDAHLTSPHLMAYNAAAAELLDGAVRIAPGENSHTLI